MKNLIMTTSSAAIMLGIVACSQAEADYTNASYEPETQQAEITTGTDADTGMMNTDADVQIAHEAFVPSEDQFEVSDLIGEEIIGADGQSVATVADIMFGQGPADNQIILRDLGIAGQTAGKLVAVPYASFEMKMDDDNEPYFTASVTEDGIDGMTEFEQDGYNDYRLASEIIGTNAELMEDDTYARVSDLIVTKSGEAKYAVVTDGIAGAVTGDRYVVGFDKLMVAQGDSDGELVINLTQADIERAPKYVEADDSGDLIEEIDDNEFEDDLDIEALEQ